MNRLFTSVVTAIAVSAVLVSGVSVAQAAGVAPALDPAHEKLIAEFGDLQLLRVDVVSDAPAGPSTAAILRNTATGDQSVIRTWYEWDVDVRSGTFSPDGSAVLLDVHVTNMIDHDYVVVARTAVPDQPLEFLDSSGKFSPDGTNATGVARLCQWSDEIATFTCTNRSWTVILATWQTVWESWPVSIRITKQPSVLEPMAGNSSEVDPIQLRAALNSIELVAAYDDGGGQFRNVQVTSGFGANINDSSTMVVYPGNNEIVVGYRGAEARATVWFPSPVADARPLITFDTRHTKRTITITGTVRQAYDDGKARVMDDGTGFQIQRRAGGRWPTVAQGSLAYSADGRNLAATVSGKPQAKYRVVVDGTASPARRALRRS